MKFFNWGWRLLGTASSFSLFAAGGLFLSIIVFPMIFLFVKKPQKQKVLMRRTISFCFRSFIYYMHFLRIFKFKVENINALKNESSCLLIANHPTLIDVVAIIAFCPNACCVVKAGLWKNIFMRKVISSAGYIPNIDPENILSKCEESVANGDVLIIFPEGTRSVPGQKLNFQRGASHIINQLGCDVRFVEISCNPPTLMKGLPWYKIPSRRADFVLSVKEKLNPRAMVKTDQHRSLVVRRINEVLLQQYCSSK